MNKLYYGDCLTIMQRMSPGSVDLIYLDPPFNSNRSYNAIYKDETGLPLPAQIEAFCDMWEMDEERERAIQQMPLLMRNAGIDDNEAESWKLWMNALRKTQPDLLAYLSYMAERLISMRGLLRNTGSIYLHCDPTASHYIKIMMDVIFGHRNFLNEIVWKRYAVHSLSKTGFDTVSDFILIYAMDAENVRFNVVYGESSDEDKLSKFKYIEKETGRRFQHVSLEQASNNSSAGEIRSIAGREIKSMLGWRWSQETFNERLKKNPHLIYWTGNNKPRYKKYLDEYDGAPLGNIWTDIKYLSASSKERVGYSTQKPVALLDRIIKSSTNIGDVVFDPFCGCASTIEAAHILKRQWIGCDIAIHAVKRVAKVRLQDKLHLVENVDFEIEGVPTALEGAQDLWNRDTYHFQKWAVEQVDGFVTNKKTGDRGIDGRLYFAIPNVKELQSMVLEVKGGNTVNIETVRSLRGVLERDDALMAGLIVMQDQSRQKTINFKREMAEAGDLDVLGVKYAKMQMLTVQEILDGKRFFTPSVARGKVITPQISLALR